eukprot:5153657-Pyramimonas_sp.AAC.1
MWLRAYLRSRCKDKPSEPPCALEIPPLTPPAEEISNHLTALRRLRTEAKVTEDVSRTLLAWADRHLERTQLEAAMVREGDFCVTPTCREGDVCVTAVACRVGESCVAPAACMPCHAWCSASSLQEG